MFRVLQSLVSKHFHVIIGDPYVASFLPNPTSKLESLGIFSKAQ